MVVTLSSAFHQTGCSVFTYMLAKLYGNSLNQPALFISLADSRTFKSCISIDKNWESQPVSMVINKTHGKNTFKPFCYKLEETVYYYHATGSNLKTAMGIKDLELLIEKAQQDFGLVVIDVDSEINGFVKLIPSSDKILIMIPGDTMAIEHTYTKMQQIRTNYEDMHGIAIKPDIFYILNKHDGAISIPETAKLLKVPNSHIAILNRSVALAREKNQGKLDFFAANLMQKNLKDSELRKLQIQMISFMGKIRDRRR